MSFSSVLGGMWGSGEGASRSPARKRGKQPPPGSEGRCCVSSANTTQRGCTLPARTSGNDQGTHRKRYCFLPHLKPLPRRQQNESELDKSPGFQGASKLSFDSLEAVERRRNKHFSYPFLSLSGIPQTSSRSFFRINTRVFHPLVN